MKIRSCVYCSSTRSQLIASLRHDQNNKDIFIVSSSLTEIQKRSFLTTEISTRQKNKRGDLRQKRSRSGWPGVERLAPGRALLLPDQQVGVHVSFALDEGLTSVLEVKLRLQSLGKSFRNLVREIKDCLREARFTFGQIIYRRLLY